MKKMRKIRATDVLRVLSAGITKPELIRKFGLSSRELNRLIDRLLSEGRNRALMILADLRSGMPVNEIALKNGFRSSNFETILKYLEDMGMIERGNVVAGNGGSGAKVALRDRRSAPRVPHPLLVTQIFELNESVSSGLILDLSENGLRISGIEAHMDETKTFFVHLGDSIEAEALTFECRCRWISGHGLSQMNGCAGFEITSIPETSSRFLKMLLDSEFALTEVA